MPSSMTRALIAVGAALALLVGGLGLAVFLFMTVPILAIAAIFILRDISKRGNEA